ncbi:lipopolysaccharide transport periplasmic protein LptA [Marinomonas mediterranea]|uniref:lipopolysaccharide transport periplasmic protein LptA n=1 Tax=Marinomonas mediterranea TaxID=119864 RepID=UPI00234AF7BC|nr:lipopolysaccharide transport periplasmic protein LptA [Marinomonas mediterranea]WCN09070.1 lipopolysaccharide transport periplasmic protein LptA [Marinomonas mediterranea]
MNKLLKINKVTLFLTVSACLSASSNYALESDTSQPLEIQADEAFYDQKAGEATYKGDILIKQGTIEIKADFLKVFTDPATNTFSSLQATGTPARFTQQLDEAGNRVTSRGDQIDYITDGRLEINGKGYLKRGLDEIDADFILYMMKNETFTAENRGNGRVKMTLQPAQEKSE